MRRYQQRQIADLLRTIGEAQNSGLFADCQEGALGLCDFIDRVAGKGTKTVRLLEGYCELLFKVHGGEASKNALRKYFAKIENSVKNDLKVTRIEVAFITYKYSMADSLESIYHSAKSDPECDAYWVPVPYYDLDSGGNPTKMNYEGSQYSSDFVVIDWQKYDIEKRKPDIVFFHNPYDAWNIVTRVHPNFHAEKMRSFADLMVYVPYYVLLLDDWAQAAVVPGMLYSDIIIAESQKKAKTYVRHMNEWIKENKAIKATPVWKYVMEPEVRFAPLESPKFDKVINSACHNFILPENWKALIGEPKRKKIVVYSNRYTDLSSPLDKRILKFKYVIDFFKKRDDVILWYRPHPLNEECLRVMAPYYYNEYQQIISDYKKEAWGIYDDTGDLHRAIAMSDAYFGEWSSVIALYAAAGKLIMWGCPSILENDTSENYQSPFDSSPEITSLADYIFREKSSHDLNAFLDYLTQSATADEMRRRRDKVISVMDVRADGSAGQAVYTYAKTKLIGG